jgi:hypothetical protein
VSAGLGNYMIVHNMATLRRPARMAAVTTLRLGGKGRTSTWRGRSAAITKV